MWGAGVGEQQGHDRAAPEEREEHREAAKGGRAGMVDVFDGHEYERAEEDDEEEIEPRGQRHDKEVKGDDVPVGGNPLK